MITTVAVGTFAIMRLRARSWRIWRTFALMMGSPSFWRNSSLTSCLDMRLAATTHLEQAAANSSVATTATPAPSDGGLSIDLSGSGLFTDRMVQIIALVTVLSIAPSILIMMTSFVRIVVVLSLLRTALGFDAAMVPMKKFMIGHVRQSDLQLFLDMSHVKAPANATDVALTTLAPAFMLSELKRAFEIG